MIPSIETRNAIMTYLGAARWTDISDTWESFTTEDWTLQGTNYQFIYISKLPNDPSNAIAIIDTGGQTSVAGQGISTIQVLVRNTDYQAAYNVAQAIKETLETTHNYDDKISYWVTTSDIMFIKEENKRFTFSINFRVEKFDY